MKHGSAIWFEIPVSNLDRAIDFYTNVLLFKIKKEVFSDLEFGVFEKHTTGINGVLIEKANHVAGSGAVLFFYTPDISELINNVRESNGIVLSPKTIIKQRHKSGETVISSNLIGDNVGYFCEILDSEGNKIALYSNS